MAVARRQRDGGSGSGARPLAPATLIDQSDPAHLPLRDEGATIPCPVCGEPFVASGRRKYCSDGCRCRAWRRRRPAPVPVVVPPAGLPRRAVTVYECATCGTRALGDQRCDDCGSFMGRVGIGGLCPACDEPVAVADLLDEASTWPAAPAAARSARRQR
jgi:hypothetical protein